MYRPLGITVSRHIMDLQRMHPEATGDLSGLLNELIVAAKTISAEVNMAGLADVLGILSFFLLSQQLVDRCAGLFDEFLFVSGGFFFAKAMKACCNLVLRAISASSTPAACNISRD